MLFLYKTKPLALAITWLPEHVKAEPTHDQQLRPMLTWLDMFHHKLRRA